MKYGISPPGCNCSIEQLAFNAYAHHRQQIEDFINALAAEEDPNDYNIQRQVAQRINLNIESLAVDEIGYIEREVVKRYNDI